jgi:hypothetical protein
LAHNIRRPEVWLWLLLHITLQTSRILRWLTDFLEHFVFWKNSMEQCSAWGANSSSSGYEMHCVLCSERTPWSSGLLEELKVPRLVTKCTAFCGSAAVDSRQGVLHLGVWAGN